MMKKFFSWCIFTPKGVLCTIVASLFVVLGILMLIGTVTVIGIVWTMLIIMLVIGSLFVNLFHLLIFLLFLFGLAYGFWSLCELTAKCARKRWGKKEENKEENDE